MEVFHDEPADPRRNSPGWQSCSEHLRPGSTLLITDLTQLGRDTMDLAAIVQELASRSVALRSLAEPWLDTGAPQSGLILDIFASIAANERARLREGTPKMQAQSRHGRVGRPPVMTPEKSERARAMRNEGMTLRRIAEELSVSPGTILKDLTAAVTSGESPPSMPSSTVLVPASA